MEMMLLVIQRNEVTKNLVYIHLCAHEILPP